MQKFTIQIPGEEIDYLKQRLANVYIPDHGDPPFRFMLTHHSGHVDPPVFLQVIGCAFLIIPAC